MASPKRNLPGLGVVLLSCFESSSVDLLAGQLDARRAGKYADMAVWHEPVDCVHAKLSTKTHDCGIVMDVKLSATKSDMGNQLKSELTGVF